MREREDGGDETSFLSDCMREKEEARDDGKEALAPTEERKHTQGRSKGVKRVKHREEGKRRQERGCERSPALPALREVCVRRVTESVRDKQIRMHSGSCRQHDPLQQIRAVKVTHQRQQR